MIKSEFQHFSWHPPGFDPKACLASAILPPSWVVCQLPRQKICTGGAANSILAGQQQQRRRRRRKRRVRDHLRFSPNLLLIEEWRVSERGQCQASSTLHDICYALPTYPLATVSPPLQASQLTCRHAQECEAVRVRASQPTSSVGSVLPLISHAYSSARCNCTTQLALCCQ